MAVQTENTALSACGRKKTVILCCQSTQHMTKGTFLRPREWTQNWESCFSEESCLELVENASHFFRLSATVCRDGLMESCTCRHGGPPPPMAHPPLVSWPPLDGWPTTTTTATLLGLYTDEAYFVIFLLGGTLGLFCAMNAPTGRVTRGWD